MKRVLSFLLVSSSILPMQLDLVKNDVKKEHIKQVFVPNKLGSIELYHGKKGFYVNHDNKKYVVKKYFTDSIVRDIDKQKLHSFLQNGYLSVNQMNDGEFSLKAHNRLNGGGVVGAVIGAFVGKAAVSLVGHGAIVIAGALTGPACPATIIVLESWFGPAIELASIKGAIAGGIALGVATGPV